SARAGRFVAAAAWRAFSNAFSANVFPVSAGVSMPSVLCATRSKPNGARRDASSRSLPLLPLARTTRTPTGGFAPAERTTGLSRTPRGSAAHRAHGAETHALPQY